MSAFLNPAVRDGLAHLSVRRGEAEVVRWRDAVFLAPEPPAPVVEATWVGPPSAARAAAQAIVWALGGEGSHGRIRVTVRGSWDSEEAIAAALADRGAFLMRRSRHRDPESGGWHADLELEVPRRVAPPWPFEPVDYLPIELAAFEAEARRLRREQARDGFRGWPPPMARGEDLRFGELATGIEPGPAADLGPARGQERSWAEVEALEDARLPEAARPYPPLPAPLEVPWPRAFAGGARRERAPTAVCSVCRSSSFPLEPTEVREPGEPVPGRTLPEGWRVSPPSFRWGDLPQGLQCPACAAAGRPEFAVARGLQRYLGELAAGYRGGWMPAADGSPARAEALAGEWAAREWRRAGPAGVAEAVEVGPGGVLYLVLRGFDVVRCRLGWWLPGPRFAAETPITFERATAAAARELAEARAALLAQLLAPAQALLAAVAG